jgi:hypothetical protein
MYRPAVLQAATSEQLSINKPIPHLPNFRHFENTGEKIVTRFPKSFKIAQNRSNR